MPDRSRDASKLRRIRAGADGESPMMDVLMVIIALGFFALSVGYAYACDRL
jgi:hypothetical protein